MLFSSISFLYYFLPLTATLYLIAPGRFKNAVLLVCSLVFYGWGEPKYVLLMGISVLQGYGSGLLIEKYREKKMGRFFCIASVIVSLSFLLYFKYTDFFLENLNRTTGSHVSLPNVALPIGISFYTFQMISYTVDVYRGEAAQKNVIHLALYIAMFPQLIAGPIVRYSGIADQIERRKHSPAMAAEGIRRFVIGLAKKVLIADQLFELCTAFKTLEEKTVLFCWMYAAAFLLHIYFDFSGYSDMAVGLGRIFGFRLPENFNYPYISASITEFWRRWHISLGGWFRDYVYIPLGGNRVGKGRWLFNIFLVWMLTGFWHGAAWNFMIWGLFFGGLLIAEKLWFSKVLEKCRVFSHIYTIFFVMLSFIIFDASDMREACLHIGGLFGAGGIPLSSYETWYYLKSFFAVLAAGAIGALPVVSGWAGALSGKEKGRKLMNILEPVGLAVLFLTVTAYLINGSFHPFLYFRF